MKELFTTLSNAVGMSTKCAETMHANLQMWKGGGGKSWMLSLRNIVSWSFRMLWQIAFQHVFRNTSQNSLYKAFKTLWCELADCEHFLDALYGGLFFPAHKTMCKKTHTKVSTPFHIRTQKLPTDLKLL